MAMAYQVELSTQLSHNSTGFFLFRNVRNIGRNRWITKHKVTWFFMWKSTCSYLLPTDANAQKKSHTHTHPTYAMYTNKLTHYVCAWLFVTWIIDRIITVISCLSLDPFFSGLSRVIYLFLFVTYFGLLLCFRAMYGENQNPVLLLLPATMTVDCQYSVFFSG